MADRADQRRGRRDGPQDLLGDGVVQDPAGHRGDCGAGRGEAGPDALPGAAAPGEQALDAGPGRPGQPDEAAADGLGAPKDVRGDDGGAQDGHGGREDPDVADGRQGGLAEGAEPGEASDVGGGRGDGAQVAKHLSGLSGDRVERVRSWLLYSCRASPWCPARSSGWGALPAGRPGGVFVGPGMTKARRSQRQAWMFSRSVGVYRVGRMARSTICSSSRASR